MRVACRADGRPGVCTQVKARLLLQRLEVPRLRLLLQVIHCYHRRLTVHFSAMTHDSRQTVRLRVASLLRRKH